jgi:hypothetical protein
MSYAADLATPSPNAAAGKKRGLQCAQKLKAETNIAARSS